MVSHLGEQGLFSRRTRQGQTLFGRHPAAQRDGHFAHGPRTQPDDSGYSGALAPHARRQHLVAAGNGPCGHRDAERGGEGLAQGRQATSGSRARGVRGTRVGMEEAVRRHHCAPAAHARQLHGLAARTLHVRRRLLARGSESFHAALRRGTCLQRQLHRQLVSAVRNGACQRRGGARAEQGTSVVPALSGRGLREGRKGRARRRLRPFGHDAPGDAAGRHGRGGQPEGRTLCRARGTERPAAAFQSPDSRRFGRLRRKGIRHGHREDHPGARSERLPRGQAPRTGRDRHHER